VSVIAVLAAWPMTMSLQAARAAEVRQHAEVIGLLNDRLQQISVLLNVVTEQQMLSDRAKSVAFRDKDRDALRRAIREDLARRDFEAALVLVHDMEGEFGYKQEAQRLREEINRQRQEIIRRQVAEASTQIDVLCRQERWSDALREAERLMGIYPEQEQVQRLPHDIETRRQNLKRQLLESWNDALNRKDIDGAIEIVKKLDPYLTRSEGETMQEAARQVFKEKLNALRVQFTLAYQDQRLTEALRIAETIIRDFPNSGIARELRETIDSLRHRAANEPETVRA
jgi:hypothetical protein